MPRALLLSGVVLLSSAAWAKPIVLRPHLAARAEYRALALDHHIVASSREPSFDVDSAFTRAIGAAGLGISSGKLVLMRAGGREEVGLAIRGGARFTPLFDVSLSGASAVVRLSF
jgi:hypothetical protein